VPGPTSQKPILTFSQLARVFIARNVLGFKSHTVSDPLELLVRHRSRLRPNSFRQALARHDGVHKHGIHGFGGLLKGSQSRGSVHFPSFKVGYGLAAQTHATTELRRTHT
jgi:hypothetical protein